MDFFQDQQPSPRDTEPVPSPPRHFRKRYAIPVALLTFLAVMIAWAVVLGNYADRTPKNPRSSDDGIVTQLFRDASGATSVRCAAVLDVPLQQVWEVVTDYEHFSDIFPHVCHTEISQDARGDFHLRGTAMASIFGRWPFEAVIRHERTSKECIASWDSPNDDLRVNRGGWTLSALDSGHTLVVYSLEAEVRPYPKFLIRDVFLFRLPGVVAAVRQEVEKRHAASR